MKAEADITKLGADLAAFRQKYGDWVLMEQLLRWLADIQRASRIHSGDYAGDTFRITVKIKK